MAKRPKPRIGGFYHIYNRGVDKRRVFENDKDRLRFIHDLYELNDADAVFNINFYFCNYGDPISIVERKQRKILVDIVAYVLMPNHFHLLLHQRAENGTSLFMQKLGIGYTSFFNTKYSRSGALFQGKYQVRDVEKDHYLRYLVDYIHHNPGELFYGNTSSRRPSASEILKRLEEYRWSSYLDYVGKKNFPSLLNFKLIRDLDLPLGRFQEKEMEEWITGRRNRSFEKIREAAIDVSLPPTMEIGSP